MRGIALKTEMQKKKKIQLPSSPCNIHPETKKKKKEKKSKINKYNKNKCVNY